MDRKKWSRKALRHRPPVRATQHKVSESVSVRQLRQDWRRVKAMVARGAKVVVTDNGVPIMQLVAVDKPVTAKFDWVAHLQNIRAIAGGKTTGANAVLEERESYKW